MFPYSDRVPAVGRSKKKLNALNKTQSGKKSRARRKLWVRDPHCHYCKRKIRFEHATIDHKVPLSKGGRNHDENFLLACKTCNSIKGSLDYEPALTVIAEWWRIENLQVSRDRLEAGDV